jgi:hypothetical protein
MVSEIRRTSVLVYIGHSEGALKIQKRTKENGDGRVSSWAGDILTVAFFLNPSWIELATLIHSHDVEIISQFNVSDIKIRPGMSRAHHAGNGVKVSNLGASEHQHYHWPRVRELVSTDTAFIAASASSCVS